MTTARRLLFGTAWVYGAQVVTVILQVGYAAVTSRLANPTAFGQYSVALMATALLTLISSGGLSQTVARMRTLEATELRSATTYAVLLGVGGAILTVVASVPLAGFWGVPGAAPAIQLLALNALTAPIYGVIVGLLRRYGTFRRLAILTFISNAVGMTIGAFAVYLWGTSSALVVSTIVAQTLVVVGAGLLVRGQLRFGRILWRSDSIGFTWRLTVAAFVQYIVGNLAKIVSARELGAHMIGQWNRAEVLGSVPFQQLQTAIVQVVYPEFRHDRNSSERAKLMWADLLGAVAWITFPLGGLGVALLPVLLPVVLGPGWIDAARYSIPIVIAGAIQPVVMVLYSAVESVGRFRPIWLMNGILVLVQVALAWAISVTLNAEVAVFATLLNNVVGHGVLVTWATRAGYLNLKRLLYHYVTIVAATSTTAALVSMLLYGMASNIVWLYLPCMVVIGSALIVVALKWRKLPPVALAAKWGVFGK